MRRLPIAALFAAYCGALGCPALALDIEVVAPPMASETPAAAAPVSGDTTAAVSPAAPATDVPSPPAAPATTEAAAPSATAPAIEWPVVTGSIEKHSPAPSPDAAAQTEPGLARGVRELLDAETAARPQAEASAAGSPAPAKSPEDRDRDALKAFYEARADAPVWVSKDGLTPKALAAISEIKRAGEWGLDAAAFELPILKAATDSGAEPSRDDLAKAEMTLSLAVLKYARFARGGVIPEPAKQLSSYLDRKPQLRDRNTLLEDFGKTTDPAALLVGLHPKQPEFERLRQAWLAAREGSSEGSSKSGARSRGGKSGTSADQLLANMQQWRWLPEDLGPFYVWVNIPEYTIRIVKNGEVVFTERITAGLVNKQTPIFSDQMERVTIKSKWIVPDSIKVREIWPSLLHGGGLMRQHGLRIERDGQDVDWHKIDWSKADMTNYTVYQPPGPRNQLGQVKFSFPSKHYVFMHDTPDKYMFAWTRRANSHGCMRIRNPLQMAAVILGKDKGWDRAKIDDLVKNGPDHNVIELEQKIPVHITYLTTRIDGAGKVQTFGDIYGHEKRVRLALGGQWDRIAKGPDHLAPVNQTAAPRVVASSARKTRALRETKSLTEMIFGGIN